MKCEKCRKYKKEKEALIVCLRDEFHATYEKIGKAIGVTRANARRLYAIGKRKHPYGQEHFNFDISDFSARTINGLMFRGIKSIDDFKNESEYTLLKTQNFGRSSYREVIKFLEKNNIKLKRR